MLEKTIPLLLLFLLGVVLKHFKVLHKDDGHILSTLLMAVIIPATIVGSLSSAKIEPRLLLLPLAGILIDLLLLCIGFLLARLLGLQSGTRGAFLVAFPTLEIGSIGYAFMLAGYGVAGLTFIALYDLGNALFVFSVVVFVASLIGQQGKDFQLSTALKRFLQTPILWAYAAGILLSVFHIHSAVLDDLLSKVSQGLLFLIMLLVALEFEPSSLSLTLPIVMIYFKTAIGISLGFLVCLLFGFTGVERIAVVVAASLPASLLSVVFARENDLDVQFIASLCSLALPISIGVTFLLSLVLH